MPFTRAHTDEQLLAELRRVADLIPDEPLTHARFAQHSPMTSSATLLRRFGGWRGALAAAGLADRYSGRAVSPKMRSQHSRALTDAEIIAELQRVARVVGTTTLVQGDVKRHSRILGVNIFRNRFGSFTAALAAAGLGHAPHANRWTEEDYLENLRRVWAHYGRAPTTQEMRLPPSSIAAEGYKRRFGSWQHALSLVAGDVD